MIVVFGNRGIEAALRASTTIPILGMTDYLVKSGFAVSMTHPGGNLTGISLLASELDLKRLELLHEAVPTAKRIGVLADRAMLRTPTQFDEAAHKLSLELVVVDVRNREELAQGLDALGSAHIDAVNVRPCKTSRQRSPSMRAQGPSVSGCGSRACRRVR